MFRKRIKPGAAVQWTVWASVCIAMLVATGENFGQEVNIADSNLEQAIRDKLNKPVGDLTQEDLDQLIFLSAPRRTITTLDVQFLTPHLATFGVREIPRRAYLALLH